MAELELSEQTLDHLLVETSRTFALAIPLLPAPTRRAVSVAYLLFRVADTLEDAETWSRRKRAEALQELADLLGGRGDARELARAWAQDPPINHAGYMHLLELTPALLQTLDQLGSATAAIVREHALRTTLGMRDVLRTEAWAPLRRSVRLRSLEELRQYCYTVAGIVGELLTDLFVHATPALQAELPTLRSEERLFGEGLQLVNILKDEATDASEERVFIPEGVDKRTLFALARADLLAAERYVAALARGGAPAGVQAFTGLPLALAREALDAIEHGAAGAKIPRSRVLELFAHYRELAHSDSAHSGK